MYKFMTDADLSLADPKIKDDTTDPSEKCTAEYFSNPLQKLSLRLLQLQMPEQFISFFKEYRLCGN